MRLSTGREPTRRPSISVAGYRGQRVCEFCLGRLEIVWKRHEYGCGNEKQCETTKPNMARDSLCATKAATQENASVTYSSKRCHGKGDYKIARHTTTFCASRALC